MSTSRDASGESGDVALLLNVRLSLVISAAFSQGEGRIDGDRLKKIAAGLIDDLIRANGEISTDWIEEIEIVEVRDANTDGARLRISA